jgi:hypothetical protein
MGKRTFKSQNVSCGQIENTISNDVEVLKESALLLTICWPEKAAEGQST